MRVRFWGTRGSMPVALTAREVRAKLVWALEGAIGKDLGSPAAVQAYVDGLPFDRSSTFGGHSPCVQVLPHAAGPDQYLLCDMGSGARAFSSDVLARRGDQPATYHVLVSHLHWDHIMGFPFFGPAYAAGNTVILYGCHAGLEAGFRRQQEAPSFPVPLSVMRADLRFVTLEPGRAYPVAGCQVTAQLQNHGGDSYGYRIESGGRTVVYTTDAEHKLDDPGRVAEVAAFFREADLVIFDSMYSLAETVSVKEDWGHSSNVVGVELCQMARARRLCLFHHEPVHDDAALQALLLEARRYEEISRQDHALEVLSAYDGMEVDIT